MKEKEHISQTILHALVKVDSITIVTVWLNPVKLCFYMLQQKWYQKNKQMQSLISCFNFEKGKVCMGYSVPFSIFPQRQDSNCKISISKF